MGRRAGWSASLARTHAAIVPAAERTGGTALVETAAGISSMLSWTWSSTLRLVGQ